MRPSEAFEIQQDRLGVLNLRESNTNLTRRIQVKRRCDGECRHTLTRNARFAFDREGRLTHLEGRYQNDLFDGFDPENRRHLQGLGVRRSSCGLAEQECYIVDSAPEGHRRRGRGNDEGDRVGDLLFADVIAQQRVWIVQNGLRDGTDGDKAA